MQSKPVALLAAGAIAALVAAGCSKGSDQSTTTTTTVSTSAPDASATSSAAGGTTSSSGAGSTGSGSGGDAAHGKAIFTANCSGCHGATGTEGGVGPSLKGEKAKKNTAQAIAWIKNPQPPMPKLYPSPLSEQDVADVAAYVETL